MRAQTARVMIPAGTTKAISTEISFAFESQLELVVIKERITTMIDENTPKREIILGIICSLVMLLLVISSDKELTEDATFSNCSCS